MATVMFFSYNVGSAIVMLITTLLLTVVTVLMGLVLLRVSLAHIYTIYSIVHCKILIECSFSVNCEQMNS